MKISIKKTKEAFDLLEKYNGNNPYIKKLNYYIFTKKDRTLSDFEIEYILENYNREPEKLTKVVKIAKWFAEKCVERWEVNFTPEKVQITDVLGENDNYYHVFLNYKKNQERPTMCFIPKKALLDDLRMEDFNEMQINFDRYDNALSKYGKKMYEHQKIAVKFLLMRKKCLLADDQGLGKSMSSIIASIEGGFKKVLVICPASLKSNWKREISTFIPEDQIGIVNSGDWCTDKRYTIINYDIVDMHYIVPKETIIDSDGNEKQIKSRKKEVKEAALANSAMYLENFDLVIIDECHKLSKNTSIRYEVISDFLTRSKIPNVYLMSGTPMTNKPINLYQVLALINHPVTLNYEYFVKTYCDGRKITSKTTHKTILLSGGSSNLDELMEKIKNSYLRRLKKDIPGMVIKTIHQRYYDLTSDEQVEYDKLWEEYEESQISIGKNNLIKELTEGIFLRQFVSDSMVKNTIALADEFLEDGNKVFIACCFNDEITKLKEYFGDKAVIYKGGMTTKQKDRAESKFMTDKHTTVFIGNIIAAGVGLTLTSSNICIFNSYDWVPGNNDQMMDRIHRIGQLKDVEVYYQLFSGTISEDMWDKIIKKEMSIKAVIKEENDK